MPMWRGFMAFSRTRKGGSEQGKCQVEMGGKPSSGLGSIVEVGLANESQDQVVYGSHNFPEMADGHAGGVFVERNIPAIMQSSLDAPMPKCSVPMVRQAHHER